MTPSMRSNVSFDPKAFPASMSRGHAVGLHDKGGVIFQQAADADAVFFIGEGKIKLTVASRQGKTAVVGILGPGDFLGVGCLADQPRRLATATALTKCEVTRVGKGEMIRLLEADATFRELFTAHLLTRNSRIEEDLADQFFNSSERRLARTLLLLANVGQETVPQPIAMRIDQGTLAEIVGTTRPRVSHFMNKFRKLGFISYDSRHLQVHRSLSSVCHPADARP
jgi:CRP/FNR family cyclic AMP-dependent transcriptional regulator